MPDYEIAFDHPRYLVLLALVPLLWWTGMRTLAGLGRSRRVMALLLRTAVLLLLVAALAEIQLVRRTDRLSVIYLLDQSLSIPETQRRAMIEYVNASIRAHRDKDKEDKAGVIVFGREAAVEIPPIDEHVPVGTQIESLIDREYTDLAGALKMARALFPHDTAKRVVLVSDGNQNLGDGLAEARALVDAGVSIDVAPILLESRGEVAVEKLALPGDVRRGQPFDLRVVLSNMTEATPGSDGVVRGKLRLVRRVGERTETLSEQEVELPPGKRVFSLRQTIEQSDFYNYEARFVPESPQDDALPQNNRATAFTHVRGRGHILLIEDWAAPGEFDDLVARLRRENLEVTVQTSDKLFSSLAELQRYDSVILANVPRSSGEDADKITNFSDAQIEMLVRNTQQMGSGLVMLGGPNSFGAGGWTGTELEKAMPVDFQIKSAKIVPVGALAMLMHASEMARGNYWQKKVAGEAIKALGSQDYCGVVHWSGTDQWLWGRPQGMIRVGPARRQMLAQLDRMTPGDMPQFDPAMVLAAGALAQLPDAAIKHMIIISDGDPSPPQAGTIRALKKQGVKVTTVAVGTHGPPGSTPLQNIATATGGKYYVVKNPRALPRIYQREARRVSRPLVFEDKSGLKPRVKLPHEMIKGLADDIPPVTGFVLTSVKESPLVEVALVSPKPVGEKNATLLAGWTYGLGRSVALTTDAGRRWATAWTGWPNYDKLFSQIVRWSMRPVADSGKFTVATDVSDGRGRVVITALDEEDEFLNFLQMGGSVVDPEMKTVPMEIRQVAPGRYVGEFGADRAGSFFVTVTPGPGRPPLRTGINVPYSDEFRSRDTNTDLLESMASLEPAGGAPGQVVQATGGGPPEQALLHFNPFRRDLPPSTASQDVWHLMVLVAGCLFFADVFNRRVQMNLDWAKPGLERAKALLLRREAPQPVSPTMERLRGRKSQIDERIEQRRASARFEPEPDQPVDTSTLDEPTGPAAAGPSQAVPPRDLAPEEEAESYTERLLKAKRKIWKDRDSN